MHNIIYLYVSWIINEKEKNNKTVGTRIHALENKWILREYMHRVYDGSNKYEGIVVLNSRPNVLPFK